MVLPAPSLDDRRFQDLVDDAKRLIQQRCPTWTDHNVSDPGVTLVETFAWMTDLLLQRLNRVPDRNYIKFLQLLGVRLLPAVPARTLVTFWLSAPQPATVHVAAGIHVATVRTEGEQAITFTVAEDLAIVPCSLAHLASTVTPGEVRPHDQALQFQEVIHCFDVSPKPGDALLVGLSQPVPSCAVTLRIDCSIAEGRGVDPTNPPLVWEAMTGDGWARCDVDQDGTGGLNQPGEVVLHVPPGHTAGELGGLGAGWLRCRVVPTSGDQRPYGDSPSIRTVRAFTVGGTARAVNAEVVTAEELGRSSGLPAQRFALKHSPVVASGDRARLEVITDQGREEWFEVRSFIDSGEHDRHFVLNEVEGVVEFGPALREPDGSLTHYGAVPPHHALIRIDSYYTGGGTRGNVAAGTIKMLKSSIPLVARLENRVRADGGKDQEDLENAKLRGTMQLRGTRAVAARDYEHQAMQAASDELSRVKCLAVEDGVDAGSVRVLLVPSAHDEAGRLELDQLSPLDERLVTKVARYLDLRRVIGARVVVEPPHYVGLTIRAQIRAASRTDRRRLETAALEALYRYFSPLTGGVDGHGWAFGRPVLAGEVFSVLQAVPGTALVEEVVLGRSEAGSGREVEVVGRIDLAANDLVFSEGHTVTVIGSDNP